jgi:hypothetical protein
MISQAAEARAETLSPTRGKSHKRAAALAKANPDPAPRSVQKSK